jgi:flavin-binding protein dodecin
VLTLFETLFKVSFIDSPWPGFKQTGVLNCYRPEPVSIAFRFPSGLHARLAFTAGSSRFTQVRQSRKEDAMSESVYKIIDLVGSSPTSWEEAAKNAVDMASKSLRDLRVAEIEKLDMKVEDGKVTAFRAKVKLSFKYGG